jgi:hypothetical protein
MPLTARRPSTGVEVSIGLLRQLEYPGPCTVEGVPAEDRPHVVTRCAAQEVRTLLAVPFDLGELVTNDLTTVGGRQVGLVGHQTVRTPWRIADVLVGRLARTEVEAQGDGVGARSRSKAETVATQSGSSLPVNGRVIPAVTPDN